LSTKSRPLRVLIADDHAPSRENIRRVLERNERFSVCASVADAAEAIQAAVRERPDVCLLDVRMSGNGLSAAWEIAVLAFAPGMDVCDYGYR
jgi:DNA-binding NarL/FixJ family response regulator